MTDRFIVAVDVGTTTIRACLYNGRAELVDSAAQPIKVDIRHSNECEVTVEIDPELLWKQFMAVTTEIVRKVPANASISMGICTQRNSFICWDKVSLRACGPFICWNDCRARKKCEEWNRSMTLKVLNMCGGFLHSVTRKPRFRAAKMLKFLGSMVSFRLMVAMEQDKHMKELFNDGQLAYGCLDTWLLMKLSKGTVMVTEPSNTSATGMFDPFMNGYNSTILTMIGFPMKLLVPLGDSATTGQSIAIVDKDFYGRTIPVAAMLADQQAALFGCGGWNKGDTMVSMGTGTFLQKNLDDVPHASMRGLYPLVGWRINGRTTFIAEGQEHDTSLIINWAHSIGLFEDVRDTSSIAETAGSSDGIFFVPAFGGLQTYYNDDAACCGFLGIKPSSTKPQMVRALLEAIAFRVYEIFQTMEIEIRFKNQSHVRICGGISANDFVCQTVATLINRPVERVEDASFAASRGVALLSGLSQGLWRKEELSSMVRVGRTFQPRWEDRQGLLRTFNGWQKAVKRCQKFYD